MAPSPRRRSRAAEVAAKAVLDEALESFCRGAWDVAYGSSGTVGAVGEILAAAGQPAGRIQRADLDWLQERLLRAQSADRVRLDGLKEDRRPVIGGGISVLRAVFDLLEIDEMRVAQGALRQGVLYDLVDRETAGDRPARRHRARFDAALWRGRRPGRARAPGGLCAVCPAAPAATPAQRCASCSGRRSCTNRLPHRPQRLPPARRLHPRQHRRRRLCHARNAPPGPAGAGPPRQAAAKSKPSWAMPARHCRCCACAWPLRCATRGATPMSRGWRSRNKGSASC